MQLNEVLKELEQQKSFSRAGRLMAGKGAVKNVANFNQKPPAPPLDMSKVLSVAEVNTEDRNLDSEAICSSARDHPSVALKNAYVTLSEKRYLFDNSLQSHIKPQNNEEAQQNHSPPKSEATMSRRGSPSRNHPAADTSHRTRKDFGNTSAFLAIPREKVQQPVSQAPPVGHYNPRYTAVDLNEANCILPKQVKRRHVSPPQQGRHAQTPEPSAIIASTSPIRKRPASASDEATPATPPLNHLANKQIQADHHGKPLQPTWPFRSKTVAHHDASKADTSLFTYRPPPAPSVFNESLVAKKQPVLCNMAKEQGRVEPPRTISVDLMYNPRIQKPIKAANVRLDKATGRDGGRSPAPLTSKDVERSQTRLNTDNYAKFKYKKEPVIADFDKYPSKDVWINSSITIKLEQNVNRSELPANAGKTLLESMNRTREVSFNKMIARKPQKLSEGFGLEYDANPDCAGKHMPTVHIDKLPERKLNAAPASEASQAVYDIDVNKFKRKLAQNVNFDSYPTREKRSITGRSSPAVFHETSAALDLAVDALALPPTMRPMLKGDPHMATHASRAKRERAFSPPTDSHDLMYSYTIDDFRKPLRKGAVGFDQMVSREKHAGSMFANSMKEMSRK